MAVDLQVVFPQESIRITGVSRVPGSAPAVFDVRGVDFSAVDEVLLNELEAPDFAVLSHTRLLVTAPPGLTGTLQTVNVVSRNLVMTEQSFLRFRFSRVPSKVSGILRLIQYFTKVLFTTPGSDIFNKQLGAGGLQNIGRGFSKAASGSIVSDFVVAVGTTTRQIIAVQSRMPSLPPAERLLTARVSSARFVPAESALKVAVEVTSQAGRAAVANLTY